MGKQKLPKRGLGAAPQRQTPIREHTPLLGEYLYHDLGSSLRKLVAQLAEAFFQIGQ